MILDIEAALKEMEAVIRSIPASDLEVLIAVQALVNEQIENLSKEGVETNDECEVSTSQEDAEENGGQETEDAVDA